MIRHCLKLHECDNLQEWPNVPYNLNSFTLNFQLPIIKRTKKNIKKIKILTKIFKKCLFTKQK